LLKGKSFISIDILLALVIVLVVLPVSLSVLVLVLYMILMVFRQDDIFFKPIEGTTEITILKNLMRFMSRQEK